MSNVESGTAAGSDDVSSGVDPVWRPLTHDPALSGPVHAIGASHTPRGGDLRLDIGWESFERLVAAIAHDVLGLIEVRFRRYGLPGQAQHGIDLVGRTADSTHTVIQCKQVDRFTAADLRAAVGAFASGRRPFDATRLIIATSSEDARATQVQDALADLQRQRSEEFHIDLWGPEEFNDVLRDRADIVARFWSRETAETFCTGAPLPGVAAPEPRWGRVADQVLFGPLEVDGLDEAVASAAALLEADPSAAAEAFGAIAHHLLSEGFAGHAHVMWRRQITALAAAGDLPAVAHLSARLAVLALHRGDSHQARQLEHGLKEAIRLATVPIDARARQLAELVHQAVVAFAHPLGEMEPLLAAISSALEWDEVPEYFSLLVLYAAEIAAANEVTRTSDSPTTLWPGASTPKLDGLLDVALDRLGSTGSFDPDGDLRGRLRLARARLIDEARIELVRDARSLRVPRRQAALALAAQARRDALDGSPDSALASWRQAVAHALQDAHTEDAAGWLYAIRNLNVRYGPWTDQLEDEHFLAQSLPRSPNGVILGRTRDPENDARRAALGGRPVEAVLAARRWLADSIIIGSWADEDSAAELLGDLYAANAEPDRAALCYQWSGEAKKLVELAKLIGDHALPLVDLASRPWWQRTATLTLIEAQRDLLTDDHASALLDQIIHLVKRGRVGEVLEGPSRGLTTQATKTMCALASRGTVDQAKAVMAILSEDVEREENRYFFHDDHHVEACIDLLEQVPELSRLAVERILDLASHGVHDALQEVAGDHVIRALSSRTALEGATLSEADRQGFIERLRSLASSERYEATVALVELDDHAGSVVHEASRAFRRILDRAEPDGHTYSFGTRLVSDAFLVRVLDLADRTACAEKLIAIAENRREAASNRQDALLALCNVISLQNHDEMTAIHVRSRTFVDGHQDGSALDDEMTNPHPLSAFKVSLGSSTLRPHGLRLAARSAATDEHRSWVRDRAMHFIRSEDAELVSAAASLLSTLPDKALSATEPALLAGHRLPVVRQLAAYVAATNPVANERLLQDALRDVPSVRLVLAERLSVLYSTFRDSDVSAADRLLDLLQADPRHSVRSVAQVVRRAAPG